MAFEKVWLELFFIIILANCVLVISALNLFYCSIECICADNISPSPLSKVSFLTNTNNRKWLIKCFYSAVNRLHFIICCVLVWFTSSKQTKQPFLHVAWEHSCQCASVQLQSASYWQPPNSGRPVAPTWATAWVSVSWEKSPIDLC